MTTSRRSQVTSSYGWTPSVVQTRSTRSPPAAAPLRRSPAALPACGRCRPRPCVLPLVATAAHNVQLNSRCTLTAAELAGSAAAAGPRRDGVPHRGAPGAAGRLAQRGDLPLEVVQRVERPVDAGEPQVGHLVELAQRPEDRQADLVARHLGRAPGPDGLLDPLREQRDRVLVDRPALAGLAHPAMIFVRLNGSVTPLRLTTASTASSTVVNRLPHSGQDRRRRISWPSSASRESTTRESACRQYGHRIARPPCRDACHAGHAAPTAAGHAQRRRRPRPVDAAVDDAVDNLWAVEPQPVDDLHPCNYYMLGLTLCRRGRRRKLNRRVDAPVCRDLDTTRCARRSPDQLRPDRRSPQRVSGGPRASTGVDRRSRRRPFEPPDLGDRPPGGSRSGDARGPRCDHERVAAAGRRRVGAGRRRARSPAPGRQWPTSTALAERRRARTTAGRARTTRPPPGQPQRRRRPPPRTTCATDRAHPTSIVRRTARSIERTYDGLSEQAYGSRAPPARHAASKVVQMFEYVAPRRYGLASRGVSRTNAIPTASSGSATHHVPTRHWPTGRADVSTDDRTSRQHQQTDSPRPPTRRRRCAAARRAGPAARDAPQLRASRRWSAASPTWSPPTSPPGSGASSSSSATGWSATATRRACARSARRSAWCRRPAWPTSSRSWRRRASCAATRTGRARSTCARPASWSTTRRCARPGPTPAYVPLLGRIAAGGPILAEQAVEDVFPLPRELVGEGDVFMLQVKGDSMIDAAICDGDWVVVRQQPTANDGDIVAAMIDGEATVKTLPAARRARVADAGRTRRSTRSRATTPRSWAGSSPCCAASDAAAGARPTGPSPARHGGRSGRRRRGRATAAKQGRADRP